MRSIHYVAISIGVLLIATLCIVLWHRAPPETNTHKEYYILHDGKALYQCEIPISYGYSKLVSSRSKSNIHRAFKYWNSVYGGKLFIYKDAKWWRAKDGSKSGVVLIDVDPDEDSIRLATTRYTQEKGCLRAIITLFDLAEKDTTEASLESVLRHEIGHSLGLGHRDTAGPTDLMFEATNTSLKEPKQLSKEETKAFKYIYYNK